MGDRENNDADADFVKKSVEMHEVDEAVHGVTNSEILWGGPRGPGLVYVVQDLVKATSSLAGTVALLKASEADRASREQAALRFWRRAAKVGLFVITPATVLPFLRLVYVTIQPWLAHHGYPLPPLETGVRTSH